MLSASDIDRVQKYLEENRIAMTATLEHMVRMETPSRVATSQPQIIDYLSNRLKEVDYDSEHMRGTESGGYLYSRPKSRKRSRPIQLLIGHCDTVWPLGTIGRMPIKLDSAKMHGPGVFDMKAGLTQILFALKTIDELKLNTTHTPLVLINSDEEIGSRESTDKIRRLARIADRAYIIEPPLGEAGHLKTARKGIARYTLSVKGESAHAGLDPGKGASAIVELSHQIQQLFALNDHDRGITVNIGMIEGGISPNVVAPESKAVVDVRVLTYEDAEAIEQQIRNLTPQNPATKITVEGGIGRPPMEHTKANRNLWKAAKVAGNGLGLDLAEATAGGGSDGNTTSLYCATLDGLGTVGDGAHAPHEFIYIDKLIERTALLTLLICLPDTDTAYQTSGHES